MENKIMNKQKDLQLTEHFMLSEFTRSATAERHHLDNSLDTEVEKDRDVVLNLHHICETILEPLRRYVGRPIVITSGYRCPELNALLGGAVESQHMKGEAVDFVVETHGCATQGSRETHGCASLRDCFVWLQDNTRFDQLILESRSNGSGKPDTVWIHVSLRYNDCRNRQRAFRLRK